MPDPSKLSTPPEGDALPLEFAASVLRGRWNAVVIVHLLEGPRRFFQLMRDIEGVPRQALAHCLDELERSGVVSRRFDGGEESRLEYGLTETGKRLRYVLGAMHVWGQDAVRSGALAREEPRSPQEQDTGRQEP